DRGPEVACPSLAGLDGDDDLRGVRPRFFALAAVIGFVGSIFNGGPTPPGNAYVPNPLNESPPTTPGAITYGIQVFRPGMPPPYRPNEVQIVGRLAAISPDSVRISRPGLPDFDATLPSNLTPMLDGHAVPWSAVPQGSEVQMKVVPRGNES